MKLTYKTEHEIRSMVFFYLYSIIIRKRKQINFSHWEAPAAYGGPDWFPLLYIVIKQCSVVLDVNICPFEWL